MASSYNFVFAAIVALAILACNCRADLIDDVCAESGRSTLCIKVFRSDPRSKSVLTYKLLAEISIENGQQLAEEVSNVAKSVETPANKDVAELCINALHEAIGVFEGSKKLLSLVKNKETQKALDTQIVTAWQYSVGSCDNAFYVIPQPPQLKQANQNLDNWIEIIHLVVSKLA